MTPEIPDDEYVCFYPMSKRRGEEYNWYDLSFEDRADLMADHGEVGKEYAGKIKQVIASSVGFDSHEWGVTLFGSDPTDIKDIVYEMRFDPASSRYGEFGEFYIGRRFPPEDLGAYFGRDGADASGRRRYRRYRGRARTRSRRGPTMPVPAADPHTATTPTARRRRAARATTRIRVEGGHGGGDGDDPSDADIRGELADLNIYAGKPSGEDVYATVLYSEADVDELFDEVEGLRGNFDHYGTHVKTAVYEGRVTDRAAVVSIWDTASAAETAAPASSRSYRRSSPAPARSPDSARWGCSTPSSRNIRRTSPTPSTTSGRYSRRWTATSRPT